MSEEEPSGILIQIVAAVAGIILIGAGIYISTHGSAPPRRVSRPPPAAAEPAPEEITPPPQAEPVADPSALPPVESLEEWLALSRGRLSRFSPGTPEHELFRRSLMALLRSHPAGIETATRTLLKDPALEPAARTLLVNGLG